MKKIVSILLALCMVAALALAITPVVSATGMTATIVAPSTLAIGDVFTLAVEIENNEGFNNFQLYLNFDPNCYEVIDQFEKTDMLDGWSGKENLIIGTDKASTIITANGANADNCEDDGVILVASLKVKDTAARDMDQSISFDVSGAVTNKIGSCTVNYIDADISIDGTTANTTGTTEGLTIKKQSGKNNYKLVYTGIDRTIYLPDISTVNKGLDFSVVPYTVIDSVDNNDYTKSEMLFDGLFDDVTVPVNFYIYGMNTVMGDVDFDEGEYGCSLGLKWSDEAEDTVVDTNITVHCYPGSNAEAYCKAAGVNYVYIEEFNAYGTQNRTDGNGFRFVARMRFAEMYTTAKVIIKTAGKSDKEVPVNVVYQSLRAKTGSGATYEAVKTAAGYYLTAIAINDCPSGKSFTFETYVTDEYGTDILVDTQEYTYTA